MARLAAKADVPNVYLKVATAELPIFYLFSEPVLTRLKLYLFTHTRRDKPSTTFNLQEPLSPERQQLLQDAQDIAKNYLRIPRQEIWGSLPLTDLLRQIQVLRHRQLLQPKQLPEIIAAVERVLDQLDRHVRDSIKNSHPTNSSAGEWRLMRLHTLASTYQLKTPDAYTVFLTHDHPYYLHSSNPKTTSAFAKTFETNWTHAERLSEDIGTWRSYLDEQLAELHSIKN